MASQRSNGRAALYTDRLKKYPAGADIKIGSTVWHKTDSGARGVPASFADGSGVVKTTGSLVQSALLAGLEIPPCGGGSGAAGKRGAVRVRLSFRDKVASDARNMLAKIDGQIEAASARLTRLACEREEVLGMLHGMGIDPDKAAE